MIDTTLVTFAFGFLVVAGIAVALAVVALGMVVRDLRSPSVASVATVAGPSERAFTRAA